ncbi:B3 domain-containing transcription factor VRN1-like [Apium graveolens]|uniref:B3 domain-containing transcription factor VRN1-like n=1 Tax=Apium graveolens TaxID=4045 RepID=UPI003D7A0B1B
MDISDSPVQGRSFCKIMLSEICLHDKIMIPKKFVRKYGKYLNVRVYLKTPGHAVWDVDLVRDADKMWLQNGWAEFSRFYSLCFGHFLVFNYQGSCNFNVFIYDKRGTEMDYPLVSRVPHMDEQANLNLREFTDKRKRAKIDIDELKACKKTRANSACTEACHVGECLMRKLQHQKISVTSDNALIGILGGFTADAGKAKALALAKDFKSENPTFILTVRPSFVDRRSQVDIKRAFAQRHMRREQNFKVNLQVEGRSWEVMCSVRRDRCRFARGWKQFAEDNLLSVGDICVFELVNTAQLLLNVYVYRAEKC